MSEQTRGTNGFHTLGELVDLINEEGTPTPAVQALIMLAHDYRVTLLAHGRTLVGMGEQTVPVGEPELVS